MGEGLTGASMMSFRNKVVVITGANAGIGRALSQRFAVAGAWIAMLDLEAEPLEAFADHLSQHHNTRARGYVCDVSDPVAVHQTFNRIVEEFDGVDVLINNAGVTHHSQFVDTDLEVFRRVMEVNYFGALHCTKAALSSLLARKGLLITLSSMSGFTPLLDRSAYAASKHALHGLFDSLRVELDGQGVGVMLVCPGYTATEMSEHALRGDGTVGASGLRPGGREASTQEVAEQVFQGARKRRRLLVLRNVDWRARIFARLCPGLFDRYLAARLSSRN